MIGSTFSTPIYKQFAETGDKSLFEHVIDDLILEKYSDDDNIKNFIKGLPSVDKRMSTLSLMSDDNVLWKKIYEIHRGNDTKYNKIKKIILLLRDYVKIADVERKSHGEILTPFNELAKPMVNLMDKYDEEFWTIPTNKVLDSSAGYGTFLILCLYKFMEGLKDFEPNEDLRLKHIIENQLYYGELQSRSVFSWLVAIDPNDEYDTNIYWGSYLDEGFDYHMKNVWNIEKFDLIIQNPPYQVQKDGFTKTQPIWNLFVEKSLKILKDDKYMIMVPPNGWRNIDGIFKKIQNLIKERQLLEIKIFSDIQAMKYFNASIFFDYYILKNKKGDKVKTTITTAYNETFFSYIDRLEFIPDGNIDEIEMLIAKDNEDRVNVLHSFSAYETRKNFVSDIEDENFIYPCISNVYRNEQPKILYSSVNNRGHFGIPKLVCGMASSGTNFFIDENGNYGLTQFSFAIIDDSKILEKIKIAMKSENFQKIIRSIPNNSSSINFKILKTFRKDFWKEFI